jgi:hypothetical protein
VIADVGPVGGVEAERNETVVSLNGRNHSAVTGSDGTTGRRSGQDDVHAELVGGVAAQSSGQEPQAPPAERLAIYGEPPQPRCLKLSRAFDDARQAQQPAIHVRDVGRQNVFRDLK